MQPPKKLREHINSENLRPDPMVFSRSTPYVQAYAILPFLFIAVVVAIAFSETLIPPILVLVSLPLLLASQRCFQTLVHDLSHKLFSSKTRMNDVLGNWLVAGWTGTSVPAYRSVHMQHHRHNGSALDPEHISYSLVRQRGGMLRHCLRYILGLEALRLIKKYYGSPQSKAAPHASESNIGSSKTHIVGCQTALAAMFYFSGAFYLYLIWLYLAVTWNPMFSSLRFLVEHPGESDLTVSTTGNLLERLYFAPFNFNFHLEHHLWPSIPPYRLPEAHRYLVEQGYFERHPEFLGAGFVKSLRSHA